MKLGERGVIRSQSLPSVFARRPAFLAQRASDAVTGVLVMPHRARRDGALRVGLC